MEEFTIIDRFFKPLADKDNALSLEDDAAFLQDKNLVVCKDMLVQDTHFFATDHPTDIARKALRVNISDCAAMGAKPVFYMLGLTIPKEFKNEDWLQSFHNGLQFEQDENDITLLGGDTIVADKMVVSITIIAKANKVLKRSTAKVGDNIYVTGNIGDSGLGLRILQGSVASPESWVNRQLVNSYNTPPNRVQTALNLNGLANSCTDISDSLLLDLENICTASKCGASLNLMAVPISEAAQNCINNNNLAKQDLLEFGDDYELVFTASKEFDKQIMALNGISCQITKIGETTQKLDITLDSKKIEPKGYKH